MGDGRIAIYRGIHLFNKGRGGVGGSPRIHHCPSPTSPVNDYPLPKFLTPCFVSVFKFPDEDVRRQLWIQRIPRSGLIVTTNTVICINHFEQRFIITEEKSVDSNGVNVVVARRRPGLTKDAYPTIFPSLPSYLSVDVPAKRKDPDDRRKEIDARDDELLADFLSTDYINSFCVLKTECLQRLSANLADWIIHSGSDILVFYKFCCVEIPYVPVSIKILSDLSVSVFVNGVREHNCKFVWITGSDCKVERWSHIENLLSRYASVSTGASQQVSKQSCVDELISSVKLACNILNDSLNSIDSDDVCSIDNDDHDHDNDVSGSVNVDCIRFCTEQLALSILSQFRRRYSNDMLRFAFTLYTRSSTCYRIIRDSNCIVLPQYRYLRKLSEI